MASGHSKELVRDLQAVWQVAFDERFAVAAVQHGVATWYEVFDYGSVDDDEDVEAAAIDARLLEEKLARDEAQRQADESGRLGARNVGSTIDAIIDARLRELEQQDPHAESEETRRLAKFLNVRKKQHNSRSERHTLSALSQLVQFGDAELLEALQREEELMADWDTADTTEGEPETRRAPGPSTSNAARADNAGSGAGAGAPALASIADAQGAFSGRAHWSRETAQARAAEMMAAARAVASTSASASTSRGKTLRRSRRTKDESGAQEPALALQAGAGPSASANASTSASAGVGAEPSGSRQTIKTEDVDEEVGDDDDDEEMET